MSTTCNQTCNQSPSPEMPASRPLVLALALLATMTPFATAQAVLTGNLAAATITENARPDLPDSPGVLFSSSADAADLDSGSFDPAPGTRAKHAGRYQMTVAPGETADPMAVHDKVVGGLIDSVSLFSATGWFASAGWEQLTNGSPNYGTDRGAFGRRLGCAAVRDISETVFSESLFAPMFHEDPRYYKMGRGHSFVKRFVYSGTRVLVTRTDGGRATPNLSLIAGDAAGAALTTTYYPAMNTTFSQVASTFGGSLGGNAIGFVVTEFLTDAMELVHLKKAQ